MNPGFQMPPQPQPVTLPYVVPTPQPMNANIQALKDIVDELYMTAGGMDSLIRRVSLLKSAQNEVDRLIGATEDEKEALIALLQGAVQPTLIAEKAED